MKRKILIIARVLLLSILMVAVCSFVICQKEAEAGGKKAKAPVTEEATTLTFWTFQELHKGFMDDAVAIWNEANPDRPIRLVTDVYPYEEMHNKLLIALQAGTGAPDLADIEISMYANYLKGTPSLVPLNDIIEPEKDNLIMGRFESYAKEGKYYGIDYHVGATVMYYNTDILDQAGVSVDDIKTIADYVEAGKKVKDATGIPMTVVEVTEHWTFYQELIKAGSDIFDKNGEVILDNQTNIDVLQALSDWVNKDKIAAACPGGFTHTEEFWAFFNDGGAASLEMPMWYMGRFLAYMPDLKGKITIAPAPSWTEGGTRSAGMGGTGTSITVQCKNQELAKEFLATAKLSREGSIKTWTILGFDPLRWDVWDAPEMTAPNDFTDYFENGTGIFNVLLEVKDEINPIVITEKYPAAINLLKANATFKAVKEQSATPEEVLEQIADELRAME
jgi:arabinosaccharide transport system substrate-binding protein